MCGRFALNATTDELIREFVAQGGRPQDWRPGWEPAFSIAPTDLAPVIRAHEGRELELARWDWPKPTNRPKGPPIINARIEKLTGAFWRTGFARARCLVPMTGYFEWTGEKGDKTPHYIHGTGLLAAAGMTRLVDSEPRFVVITREGRDAAGDVHDRMPSFLPTETWDEWLSDAPGDPGLQQFLTDASEHVAGTLHSRIVDRRVNSVRGAGPTDPTLIEPAG
ncbi:SOS response-associated peptidase [Microbacterium betulae]|uniref:Abasic site processing protein n=1 Tax=Microbacterium betulae TaxID=2981139 RepID=A0AA97I6H6_9MICO|nr:SOS response-associated peptidase [Microbacterium sp. AB]WOF23864.1 SOS response-associated peptidase [Microbacterium sp. AB]